MDRWREKSTTTDEWRTRDAQSRNPQLAFRHLRFCAVRRADHCWPGHTQTAYINLFGVGVWVAMTEWADTKKSDFWQKSDFWVTQSPFSILNSQFSILIYFLGTAPRPPPLRRPTAAHPGTERAGSAQRRAELCRGQQLQPQAPAPAVDPAAQLRSAGSERGLRHPGLHRICGLRGLLGSDFGRAWGLEGSGDRAGSLGVIFVGLGLFLALGRWNPVYYLLYKVVPGFDLFRTPARWMMLYTTGRGGVGGDGD